MENEKKYQNKKQLRLNYEYIVILIFAVFFFVCLIAAPVFRSWRNFSNLLAQNAMYGLMAIGIGFVILIGRIDLSIASTAAFTGIFSATMFVEEQLFLGVVGGLIIGGLIGALNGLIITKAKIIPFIATLGTQVIFRGLTLIITNGYPVYGIPKAYSFIGLGKIANVFPVCAAIWIVGLVIMQIVLKKTRFGQYIYAVGGNEKSAWLSGVNTDRVIILAYVLSGFFASLAGIILVLRVQLANATAAEGYELTAIASCVIGGIAMEGGKGNIVGTFFGAMMMGMIINIIQLTGISSYWEKAVTGLIILGAVGLTTFLNRRRK